MWCWHILPLEVNSSQGCSKLKDNLAFPDLFAMAFDCSPSDLTENFPFSFDKQIVPRPSLHTHFSRSIKSSVWLPPWFGYLCCLGRWGWFGAHFAWSSWCWRCFSIAGPLTCAVVTLVLSFVAIAPSIRLVIFCHFCSIQVRGPSYFDHNILFSSIVNGLLVWFVGFVPQKKIIS